MSIIVEEPPAAPSTPPPPERPSLRQSNVSFSRRLRDRLATGLMGLSFIVALTPLLFVIWYVVTNGASQISGDFLTGDIPFQYRAIGPGMGPAVAGTILITGVASLMAIPLGIMAAVYLNEYGKQGLTARFLRSLVDVMTGVPSIVMGLFIYSIWVVRFEDQTAFAGSLALGCLMLPIVIRSSEEMLRLVPDELRNGSTALGSHRWRTTVRVVLPAALPGIVSGAMLAVARAAGETAPVLFTIGIVFNGRSNWKLFEPATNLSAQIYRNAPQPFPGAVDRAWGAAFTLVAMVFILTLGARFLSRRFATEVS
jgi:phosphate transport system permease protein